MRDTLQTLQDGVPTQKYPLTALVILRELFIVFSVIQIVFLVAQKRDLILPYMDLTLLCLTYLPITTRIVFEIEVKMQDAVES